MDCATGDILAMVNLKRNGTTCAEEQNYAIGVRVNPGSTFKLVSAMALLEHGVPESKTYYCEMGNRVQDTHLNKREFVRLVFVLPF